MHNGGGWIYFQSEPRLWTVGCYGPAGTWCPESDHGSPEDAANRVHWLNGRTSNSRITNQAKPVS